jgi:hypothetical protein
MGTPKQEKLIKLILDNMGTLGSTKTMGELLKEAGYSESIQKNPYLILQSDAVKEGINEVAEQIESLRSKALTELQARDLSGEQYRDVIKAVDVLTKNHQLLTGGETERTQPQPLVVKILRDGNTTDNGNTRGV